MEPARTAAAGRVPGEREGGGAESPQAASFKLQAFSLKLCLARWSTGLACWFIRVGDLAGIEKSAAAGEAGP